MILKNEPFLAGFYRCPKNMSISPHDTATLTDVSRMYYLLGKNSNKPDK